MTTSTPTTTSIPNPEHIPGDPYKALRRAADWLGSIGMITIIIGILGAIGVGMITVEEDYGIYSSYETHPFIGAAIGLGFTALAFGTMFIFFALWAKAWLASR